MQMRDLLGFVLIPLLLLISASLISALNLWSFLGNLTMPWFLTAVAVAVALLGGACILTNRQPADIPIQIVIAICVAVLAIYGIGMIVDGIAYARPDDWLASAGGWVGFGIILFGVFLLPRTVRTNV